MPPGSDECRGTPRDTDGCDTVSSDAAEGTLESRTSEPLPPHVEETVRSVATLHAEHRQRATPGERAAARVTSILGRPQALAALTLLVLGWIGINLAAPALGLVAFDPPPFVWLVGLASLASLYIVVLILVAQRHADALAEVRNQLTLQLALLAEQKSAKMIELIEEARRDNPMIRDRVDVEAKAMAQPAEPRSVLDAIRESHPTKEPKPGERN